MANSYTVTLLGVSKTCIITGDGEIHESSAPFLEIKKSGYDGPTLLEDGRLTHFFFRFPDDPVLGQHHRIESNGNTDRDRPTPQALPPSGEYGPGNRIDYSLDASLVDEFTDSEIKATTKLEFVPTHEAEVSDPQIFTTIQEMVLANPDGTLDPSTIKLARDSPRVVIQNQPFFLRLCLLHIPAPSVSSAPPTVFLNSSVIQLLEKTCIQSEKNTKDQWTKKHTITSRDLSIDPEAGPFEITTQGLDMGSLLGSVCIPSTFASSFECINIQRTYGLEVSLAVVCGGKTYDIAFDLGPVTLLGAELGEVGRQREDGEAYDPLIDGVPISIDGVWHMTYPNTISYETGDDCQRNEFV